MENFYQAHGVNFIDAAGLRIVADGWRIAGDAENVAHASDCPGAQQHGLQADNVEIARGEVRDGFDAAGFECASDDERVHSDTSHGAAVDVDSIGFSGGHDFIDLFIDAVEGKPFGRIDFHAHG